MIWGWYFLKLITGPTNTNNTHVDLIVLIPFNFYKHIVWAPCCAGLNHFSLLFYARMWCCTMFFVCEWSSLSRWCLCWRKENFGSFSPGVLPRVSWQDKSHTHSIIVFLTHSPCHCERKRANEWNPTDGQSFLNCWWSNEELVKAAWTVLAIWETAGINSVIWRK